MKALRRQDYLQRIPIEGKFGQVKGGYALNYIRAKQADTSYAWINSIFLVMNLLVLLKVFFAWCKGAITQLHKWLARSAWVWCRQWAIQLGIPGGTERSLATALLT